LVRLLRGPRPVFLLKGGSVAARHAAPGDSQSNLSETVSDCMLTPPPSGLIDRPQFDKRMRTIMNAGGKPKGIALACMVGLLLALAGCGNNSKESQMTSTAPPAAGGVTPAQAREIARDAYIYGFPMVDSYRIQYSYSALVAGASGKRDELVAVPAARRRVGDPRPGRRLHPLAHHDAQATGRGRRSRSRRPSVSFPREFVKGRGLDAAAR
jgi:hypothetical protein